MVETVKATWQKWWKVGAAVGGALATFLAGLGLAPAHGGVDPAEFRATVVQVEHNMVRLDTLEARAGRSDRKLEWVVCDGMTRQGYVYHGKRTPQECAAEMADQ